jgi:hypothetical protein
MLSTCFRSFCCSSSRLGPVGVDLRRMGIMQRRRAVREKSLVFQKRFARKFVVIGVDRCVQTSGIVQKLMAFEEFLLRNSKLSEFVVLVQIVLPINSSTVEEEGSTDGHPRGLGRSIEGGGRQLRRRIDQVVGRTNARFANITSTSRPIYCLHQELESDDLLSLYETADCVLVTPIKEGMNTVPFEYLVCRDNRGLPGTVIVSEFAGCASSLSGAILVNPGESHRVHSGGHLAGNEFVLVMMQMELIEIFQNFFQFLSTSFNFLSTFFQLLSTSFDFFQLSFNFLSTFFQLSFNFPSTLFQLSFNFLSVLFFTNIF